MLSATTGPLQTKGESDLTREASACPAARRRLAGRCAHSCALLLLHGEDGEMLFCLSAPCRSRGRGVTTAQFGAAGSDGAHLPAEQHASAWLHTCAAENSTPAAQGFYPGAEVRFSLLSAPYRSGLRLQGKAGLRAEGACMEQSTLCRGREQLEALQAEHGAVQ